MGKKSGKKKRIGVFGGSFNPPHEGHIKMAEYARDTLGLDEVWLLVSPQNPIKDPHESAPYEDRVAMTRDQAAGHDWLVVTDLEKKLGKNKTFETLNLITELFPDCEFTWIMGADNLKNFHKWYRWQDIMDIMNIAVMARPGEVDEAILSPAAIYAAERRSEDPKEMAGNGEPGWCLIDNPEIDISSTKLREIFRKSADAHPKGIKPAVDARIHRKGLYRYR